MDRKMGERYPERNIIYNTIALNLENYIFLTSWKCCVYVLLLYDRTTKKTRREEEEDINNNVVYI